MTARNEAMSQHKRDSRELRELCAQRDAARAETKRIVALLDAANAERDQLRAEVERMRADAERYRWLRNNQLLAKTQYMPTSPREYLDAAIDAARTTHKETK